QSGGISNLRHGKIHPAHRHNDSQSDRKNDKDGALAQDICDVRRTEKSRLEQIEQHKYEQHAEYRTIIAQKIHCTADEYRGSDHGVHREALKKSVPAVLSR